MKKRTFAQAPWTVLNLAEISGSCSGGVPTLGTQWSQDGKEEPRAAKMRKILDQRMTESHYGFSLQNKVGKKTGRKMMPDLDLSFCLSYFLLFHERWKVTQYLTELSPSQQWQKQWPIFYASSLLWGNFCWKRWSHSLDESREVLNRLRPSRSLHKGLILRMEETIHNYFPLKNHAKRSMEATPVPWSGFHPSASRPVWWMFTAPGFTQNSNGLRWASTSRSANGCE